jgi:hypothetical protein
MATAEFGMGPGEFGLLGSIMAVGTLAGALLAARRSRPRLRFLLGGALGLGLFTLIGSVSPSFWLYAAILVPVGLASITFLNSCNTSIQLSVEPAVPGTGACPLSGNPAGRDCLGRPAHGLAWQHLRRPLVGGRRRRRRAADRIARSDRGGPEQQADLAAAATRLLSEEAGASRERRRQPFPGRGHSRMKSLSTESPKVNDFVPTLVKPDFS